MKKIIRGSYGIYAIVNPNHWQLEKVSSIAL